MSYISIHIDVLISILVTYVNILIEHLPSARAVCVCLCDSLGAFAKFRKSTISFIVSVRLSVPMELCSHWTDFHEM
jgi:hypothetical protein